VPVIGACIDAWQHGYRSPLWMYRYVRDQWWSERKVVRRRIDVGPDEDLYPIEGYRYQSPDLPYDPHHKEKWLNG
jgi:hypothetical protein